MLTNFRSSLAKFFAVGTMNVPLDECRVELVCGLDSDACGLPDALSSLFGNIERTGIICEPRESQFIIQGKLLESPPANDSVPVVLDPAQGLEECLEATIPEEVEIEWQLQSIQYLSHTIYVTSHFFPLTGKST